MDITPLIPSEKNIINGYGKNCFTVNDEMVIGSMIITESEVIEWSIEKGEEITLESLNPIISRSNDIELLLVGCGPLITTIDTSIREHLKEQHILLEWMDTGAACRTYNILLSEERLVAAALIAV